MTARNFWGTVLGTGRLVGAAFGAGLLTGIAVGAGLLTGAAVGAGLLIEAGVTRIANSSIGSSSSYSTISFS